MAYDQSVASRFDTSDVEPTVDVLAELAGDGAALEFAIGTGRIALPLQAHGVEVHGIEFSPHTVEQLRAKPGGDAIPVVIGDMTTTRVDGEFSLVYPVFNTIMNVTTQAEQVAIFANAAGARSDGATRRHDARTPLGRLGPRRQHRRQHQPRLNVDGFALTPFQPGRKPPESACA